MDDRAAGEAEVAKWLDEHEGFSFLRERLYELLSRRSTERGALAGTAFPLGMASAIPRSPRPGGAPTRVQGAADQEEWLAFRSKLSEVVRNLPANSCPAARHPHIVANSLVDDGRYPMFEEERAHVAASIYGPLVSLWEARNRITELEARVDEGHRDSKVSPSRHSRGRPPPGTFPATA